MSKLFVIPWPWDFHEQAAYVVVADTKEEAIDKIKEHFAKAVAKGSDPDFTPRHLLIQPKYNNTHEVENGIYEDWGCDD